MRAPFDGRPDGFGLDVVVVDVVVVDGVVTPGTVGTVTLGTVTPGTVGIVIGGLAEAYGLSFGTLSPSGASHFAFHAVSARRSRRSKPFGPATFIALFGEPESESSELSAVAL